MFIASFSSVVRIMLSARCIFFAVSRTWLCSRNCPVHMNSWPADRHWLPNNVGVIDWCYGSSPLGSHTKMHQMVHAITVRLMIGIYVLQRQRAWIIASHDVPIQCMTLLGPNSRQISHRNTDLMEIAFCSDRSCSGVITMKSWGSSIVVCAQFGSDMISYGAVILYSNQFSIDFELR